MPVIEIIDADFSDLGADDRTALMSRVVRKIVKSWGSDRPRLAIDVQALEQDPSDDNPMNTTVMPEIIESLRNEGCHAVPVVRISDSDGDMNRLRQLADWQKERGLCLRIGTEDLDDQFVPLEVAAQRLLNDLQVSPADVDLILDFGQVSDEGAMAMAARLARFVLPTLDRVEWRTFAVAAGAFPVNLSGVSPYAFGEIPRWDALLWRSLKALELRLRLDYADYAVTHPALQIGVPFAAPPQLRYTTPEHWIAVKGRRTERRGNKQFYDLCGRLLSERRAETSSADVSWGDQRIHHLAQFRDVDEPPKSAENGPGNASTWRAIATSHHLEFVRQSLRSQDVP